MNASNSGRDESPGLPGTLIIATNPLLFEVESHFQVGII
jgi:hypothetical protein